MIFFRLSNLPTILWNSGNNRITQAVKCQIIPLDYNAYNINPIW